MQQEIQRAEVGQLETLHAAFHQAAKIAFNALRRNLLDEHGVVAGVPCNHPDVGGVALIARACMCNLAQRQFHITVTRHRSSSRGTSAEKYATTPRTGGRPSPYPVAPGGPFRTSGASSRVKRSTAALSIDRTPIRNCTSGGSGFGGAAGPWHAFTPKNSVWISSKRSPSPASRARTMRSAARAFSSASGHEYTSVPMAFHPRE